jgi:hypothetical protein
LSFLAYSEMMGHGVLESSSWSLSSALLVMGDFWHESALPRISSTLKLLCGERETPNSVGLGLGSRLGVVPPLGLVVGFPPAAGVDQGLAPGCGDGLRRAAGTGCCGP